MKRMVCTSVMALLCSQCAFGAYVNSKEGLNVRTAPDISSEVVEVIGFGTEVKGKEFDGWVKTKNGFVCSDFLQEENPLDEFSYLGEWHVTAYAWTGMPCANGEYPEINYTIACNSLPLGTEVFIEGVGFRTVEDRGPTYMGNEWCDLYLEDVTDCINWGSQYLKIYEVVE